MKNYLLTIVSLALSVLGGVLVFCGIRHFDRTRALFEADACIEEIYARTANVEGLIQTLAVDFHRESSKASDASGHFHQLAYPLTNDADFLWAEWLVPDQTDEGTVFRVAYNARRDPTLGREDIGRIRRLEGALENAIRPDKFRIQLQEESGVFLSKRLHLAERDKRGVFAAVRPVYGEDSSKPLGLAVCYFRSVLQPNDASERRVCMQILRVEKRKRELVATLGGRGLRDALLNKPVMRGCERYRIVIREQKSNLMRRAAWSCFGLILGPLFGASMLKRYWQQRAKQYESHCQDLSTEVSERREMQETLQKLLAMREDERRTVASDIHDGFVQEVVSAQMFLEALSSRIDENDSQSVLYLSHLRSSIQQAIEEGRRLVRRTQVLAVDDVGLLAATHRLVAEQREKFGLDVTLRFAEDLPELDILQQRSVYRIIQESLNNVRRHSGANEATVSLYSVDNQFCVDIADQGRGFDITDVAPDSYGIRGMQERVQTMGGQLQLKSDLGEGVLVSLQIPLDRTANSGKSVSADLQSAVDDQNLLR